MGRIYDQRAYNAVVDWLSLNLHDREIPSSLRDQAWDLVALRADYPDLGREEWDWSRLARPFVGDHALELGRLIVDLIAERNIMIRSGDDDASLLGDRKSTRLNSSH